MSEVTQSGNPLVQVSMNYFETETKDKHDMSSTGIYRRQDMGLVQCEWTPNSAQTCMESDIVRLNYSAITLESCSAFREHI